MTPSGDRTERRTGGPRSRPARPRPLVTWSTLAWLVVACGVTGGSRLAAQPVCPQDERNYAVFDAVFLQRNNAAIDRPVVVSNTAPAAALLSAGNPESTVGPGARLLYGNYGAEDVGWEAGYLGVYSMRADRVLTDPSSTLEVPDPILASQTGLGNAAVARVTDDATIQSAELNMVFHSYDGGYDRSAPRPARRYRGYDGGNLDWLCGFRWANLHDSAQLSMTPGGTNLVSTYGVDATSNLFAGQVGTRGRMQFERWGVEGWMKVGIAGTSLSQSQSIVEALAPPIPFRQPTSASTSGMGMIADMNLSAIYRIDDVWGLRLGYNLMWLTGVALAPDQWDFSSSRAGGAGINGSGSVFLSGANLGLEARW